MSNYGKAFLIASAIGGAHLVIECGGLWAILGGAAAFFGGWELGKMARRLDALERAS